MLLIRDIKLNSRIIGTIKRTFSRSPIITQFLKEHRKEEPWIKKDGTIASKKRVFYTCAQCQAQFNSNQIQVDHILPIIPLNIPGKHLSYDTIVERTFCDETNLQILCKQHHKEKSQQENIIRKIWASKEKYLVYQTVNKVNGTKYIGVHKCVDYDETYYGSGLALKSALKKYGKNNFYRQILFVFDNEEDAYKKEAELVTQEVADSDEYYNLIPGGGTGIAHAKHNGKKIICYETEQVFESVSKAGQYIKIHCSNISRILNRPDKSVQGFHFFTLDRYDPNMAIISAKSEQIDEELNEMKPDKVYDYCSREIVCLNNQTHYKSLKFAAKELNLNYKSLRNAMLTKNQDNLSTLNGYYFVYIEEYSPNVQYYVTKNYIKCVELEKLFETGGDAAKFLNKANILHAAIAINKAARANMRMYGYTWDKVNKCTPLPITTKIEPSSP